MIVGLRPGGGGPVDVRADLAGVVGAVLALTSTNELRVGVLAFPAGATPRKSGDLFSAPVLSRKDLRFSANRALEVIVDTTDRGWRVEIVHGDLPPVVAEREWTAQAAADLARSGVQVFADAANNKAEGTLDLSAFAR
jgi:hypothetical protein